MSSWALSLVPGSVASIAAGANPAGIHRLLASWPHADWPEPRVIDTAASLPLKTRVEAVEKVGIDRLLNVVAANAIRASDRPAIIVDSGTATTVDCVSAAGEFLGGAILPGFDLAARSLHHYTALLPLIEIDELANTSREPLGRDTRGALCSGLFWGQLGAVNELVERLDRLSDQPATLMLTGGGASLLSTQMPNARWEPHLSLQGLVLAADSLPSPA
jgi:type III pantothenate kinase